MQKAGMLLRAILAGKAARTTEHGGTKASSFSGNFGRSTNAGTGHKSHGSSSRKRVSANLDSDQDRGNQTWLSGVMGKLSTHGSRASKALSSDNSTLQLGVRVSNNDRVRPSSSISFPR